RHTRFSRDWSSDVCSSDLTCNLIPRAEKVVDDSTFGRLEDAERVRTVRKWSEGDVAGIVHADVLGYYLLNLYGDVDSANVSGGEIGRASCRERVRLGGVGG